VRLRNPPVDDARAQFTLAKKDCGPRARYFIKNDDFSTAQNDQYHARFNATTSALKQSNKAVRSLRKVRARRYRVGRVSQLARRGRTFAHLINPHRSKRKRRSWWPPRRCRRARRRFSRGSIVLNWMTPLPPRPLDWMVMVSPAALAKWSRRDEVFTVAAISPWVRGYITESQLASKDCDAVKINTTRSLEISTRQYLLHSPPMLNSRPIKSPHLRKRVKLV